MTGARGFSVLFAKELREAWRTRRLPLVAILFVLVGLVSPLTAKFLPDILKAALGDQMKGIPMPIADATAGLEQLQKNLGQLGALAAIALAMGSVSGELDRGTAALVLAQPVGRPAFLAAKLAAIGVVLAIATALSVIVAWVYTAILFEPLPVGGWVALAALDWLALFAWAALTLWASAATGSTTAAAGLGFVGLIVLSLAAVIPLVDQWLPSGLTAPALWLAANKVSAVDGAKLATAVAGSLVVVGVAIAAAMGSFRRREL
ncbi:MAG TPA: ABC transporter permease subunit [Candidatus Limnocylindrales bacterium]